MSKQAIDSIVLKIFIALVIFDAVSVLYLTPKQVRPPVEAPTATTPPPTEEKDNSNVDPKPSESDFEPQGDEDDAFNDFYDGDKKNKNNDTVSGLLVIQSCTSHQAHLDQIKAYLTAEYPAVTVETIQYPLPPIKALLSKFLQYIHWIMLALNLFGDKIFGFLGMAYPAWYLLMKEKKMIVMVAVIGGSMLLSGMVNKTDAFEVFFDGELVFSKFSKGFLPTTQNFDAILLK